MTVVSIKRIPLSTRAGTIWIHPIRPPCAAQIAAERAKCPAQYGLGYTVCDFCPLQEQCREACAHNDFIGCERPLEREMIDNG